MRTERSGKCIWLPCKDVDVNETVISSDGTWKLNLKYGLIGLPMLATWWLIYTHLLPFATWLARHVVGLLSTRPDWLGNTEHLTKLGGVLLLRHPKGPHAPDSGGLWCGHHPLLLYPGAYPENPCRQAGIGWECAGCPARHCNALLFLLGGAAFHRFPHRFRATRSDLLLSHFRPDGQRDRSGAPLRALRLENRRHLL